MTTRSANDQSFDVCACRRRLNIYYTAYLELSLRLSFRHCLCFQASACPGRSANVAFNAASASLLAIGVSFLVIRRLLRFPLLQTDSYVALTFVGSFAVVASGLKFFRIDFSSPQFFLGMVIIMALVEMFFYAHRRWAPLHIAVVPGTATPAKLPNGMFRSIKYTHLAAVPSGEFAYSGVVADLSSDLEPEWENFLAMAALRGIPVHHFKQFNELITGRVTLDHLWENTWGGDRSGAYLPAVQARPRYFGGLAASPIHCPAHRHLCNSHQTRDTRSGYLPSAARRFRRPAVYSSQAEDNDASAQWRRLYITRRRADYSGGPGLASISYR